MGALEGLAVEALRGLDCAQPRAVRVLAHRFPVGRTSLGGHDDERVDHGEHGDHGGVPGPHGVDHARHERGHDALDEGKDTIAYCRIGERSSHTWFVLSEILGYQNVKNYDGSWSEYGSLRGVPVAVGDEPGQA